jgi:hypothetical protein
VTFPTKKKKGNPWKKQPIYSPLQCQSPVWSLKFKSVLKKEREGMLVIFPIKKKEPSQKNQLTLISKFKLKSKTVSKKKEKERMLVTFPTKKKKENPQKKQPIHSPLQCQSPVQSSKFKFILKKKKRGC